MNNKKTLDDEIFEIYGKYPLNIYDFNMNQVIELFSYDDGDDDFTEWTVDDHLKAKKIILDNTFDKLYENKHLINVACFTYYEKIHNYLLKNKLYEQ